MENLDQLHAALLKADAAGDTASAKILADHIRAVSAAPAAAKPELTGLANAWDGTKNFGLGLVKGVLAPIDGGAQLLTQGVASGVHAIAPGSAADKWTRDQAKETSDINTDRENKYQAMTPGSVAAGVGNVLGQIVVPLKGTQAVRGASLAAKLGSAVTTGAVVGAAQPVYNAGTPAGADAHPVDYWGEKSKQVVLGSMLGGGLSAVGSGVRAGAKALQPLIAPGSAVGDMLAKGLSKVAGSDASTAAAPATAAAVAPAQAEADGLSSLTGSRAPADVLERLRAAKPLVDGSLPTTAQVAGVPELVMAEKALKNNPAYRGAFEDRSIANNLARLGKLLSIAKTPDELQAAIAARGAEAGPLYSAAKAATLPVDESLTELLARPSAQQAIKRGMSLAAERGEKVTLDGANPAASSASTILDASGKPFTTAVQAQSGQVSGNMLQYLKMGLDDMQSAGRTQGIGSHEAKALSDTQDALTGWMENNSPQFARANAAYAKASQPINTMQAAQDLHQALSSGTLNAAGDVSPVLSQYRTQLAKALKNAPYGIEPDAQKSLEAIQNDLQRETISNSIKSAGSDTAFNMQAPNWLAGKLYGQNMDGKSVLPQALGAIGGFFNPLVGSAGGAIAAQKMGQFVGNRVNSEFQQAMLNPDYFAKLLGEALDRQAGGPSTFQKLAPVWTRGATVGAENVVTPGP